VSAGGRPGAGAELSREVEGGRIVLSANILTPSLSVAGVILPCMTTRQEYAKTDSLVREALRAALRHVWLRFPEVVRERTQEQSVMAKVEGALQPRIDAALGEGFRVDSEYNRWHDRDREGLEILRTKYLEGWGDDGQDLQVRPDLIVHDGTGDLSRNLLVVEAKQGTVRACDRASDYRKLDGFLTLFQYRQAAFLEFDGRGGPPRLQWLTAAAPPPDPSRQAAETVQL
jgi:hypothetical protein